MKVELLDFCFLGRNVETKLKRVMGSSVNTLPSAESAWAVSLARCSSSKSDERRARVERSAALEKSCLKQRCFGAKARMEH